MQAAVAVGFGALDVVAHAQNAQVILLAKQLCNGIGIVEIGAYHADAGDIMQVIHGGLGRGRKPLAAQLLQNAVGGFDAAFHVVNGIAAVAHAEFIIQNFELGAHLAHGGLVTKTHGEKFFNGFLPLGRQIGYGCMLHAVSPDYNASW